jgi:hypothetical protein
MIGWLNPALLAGLAAVVCPVLVHLLRRHRAERVPFPSLRFIRASPPAAVRFRDPTDVLLLILRAATIALAAVALAGPVFLTSARVSAWDTHLARVVLIDSSDSMRRPEVGARAAEAASAEERGAAWSRRVESPLLRPGLQRAVAALAGAPPARREIVVLSDFQAGSLDADDLALVPAAIGLRLIRTGALPESRSMPGLSLLASGGAGARHDVTLRGPSTVLRIVPDVAKTDGLRLIADGDASGLAKLLEIVASAGTPEPDPARPVVVVFRSAALPAVQRTASGWMLRTCVDVALDTDLKAAAVVADAAHPGPDDNQWFTLVRDRQQQPLVRAASAGSTLILDVAATPPTLVSAAVVRAVLRSREPESARLEQEVQAIPERDLARWSRPPAATAADVWRSAEPSDARWCWGAVLLLLGLEAVVRRQRQHREEERARAA